ncbi:polyprenyl synthetase family protein [Flavobacterium agricola]|uniref:Polyprenyl synthetase family protein n=1 Tax=Flavobacterium agricola TaxID=2870839 RepID=A0ABY6M1Y0_9FLAO|nr:polyprenyl synthetase family protein [Flavobacterium agricola]UYW01243.1 polyprenyl synthetase family protein [Flavobacterium agricola]
MRSVAEYQEILNNFLADIKIPTEPKNLYEPISYILSIGGKRMRPILTLMGAEIFDCDYKKAFHAATAVELFHNFSLIHDDIMDDAPLRRGHQTVHEKWNTNTGILSGDALLILAYQYFENYEPHIFRALAKIFSKTALEVCEGQQLDIDFEQRNDVAIDDYILMIKYKTAVLVAAALKMGAVVAETSDKNADLIYDFGLNLGIAFQLQDDYLDAFGDPLTFGKQVGGDIIENKKTFLYLKALELSDAETKKQLIALFNSNPENVTEKIETVKQHFTATKAVLHTQELIETYTLKAFKTLEDLDVPASKKQGLIDFGNMLMKRNV